LHNILNLLKDKISLLMEDENAKNEVNLPVSDAQTQTLALTSKLEQKSIEITKEKIMSLDNVLKPLQDVDGYLASAIFDMGGEVLVKHNNSKYNVEAIGANAVAMINAAVKAVAGAGLGKCHFIQVNSELGIFGAVWAVEDQSVAAVLLAPKGNVGLAKLALTKVGEDAGSKLA
jgi:predicted regulator of Ras-like GTPase activity (Roadblock/LC7/MglB family)